MSIIRDFVTNLPAACGVPAGLSEIFGKLNGELFDFELANPDGPLHRKHFESVFDRVYLGVGPWKDLASHGTSHALALLEYVARTIDADGGEWRGKAAAKKSLIDSEQIPANSEVVKLLTVEQASTLGNWA